MALSGEIMKYVGNELMNVGSKGLARAGSSALSSLIPKAATNIGTSMLDKAAGLGLSKNAGKWVLDTGILDTDAGVSQVKDFMKPILGEDTANYKRLLEQIGEGEYQMAHRPNLYLGDNEVKFPLSNMEADPDFLPKIYGDTQQGTVNNLLRLGNTGEEARRSANIIAQYHNQPDKMVKVYRQAPKDMNYGDWVGLTPEYANFHEGNSPENRLWEREVPASEVMFAGDDINEWGYYPKEVQLDDELGQALDLAIQNTGVDENAAMRAMGYITNDFGRLADKSGKPVKFYHSTPNEFSEFDNARLGDNTGYSNTALGHFVTEDKDFSSRFRDINNEGNVGTTMELQAKVKNPVIHPYMAAQKYSDPAQLDRIVEDYYKALGDEDTLNAIREYADEDGVSLYDAYMDNTLENDPFEFAADERNALMNNGYDAVEIVEGPKSGLVEGSTDGTPVSSLAVLEGKNLRPTTHLPISSVEGESLDIPVSGSVLNKVAKYLESPTDAKLPARYSNLISKAKNYKSLDRFEKMNNPIKGSEIWGEKPKSYFERDSRAVRINMFPNEAVKGSGITKQYLLNLLKDAYDQGITDIVPSYGSYTKEGASFMDHLAEQGWVKANGKNGWNSYEIAPKIAEWEKTSPLADIYNEAHNMAEGKNFRPKDANADGVINWNDVKAVYNQAKQQQAELDKMGRAIAEKEGFPEYTDFSPKSIESMENKVKRKGGDYSLASMKDHTRNKIMMNSWEDVPKVISDMEQMGLSPDVEFVLNDWGYKGLHITGRFDNGLGWEIQLTTPEDWPRKLKSDAIYDKWRNTQLDTASPKEVMGYLNAMRESKAMWAESKIPDLSMYDNVTGR